MKQENSYVIQLKKKRTLAQACLWGQHQIGDTKFSILPQNLEKGRKEHEHCRQNF